MNNHQEQEPRPLMLFYSYADEDSALHEELEQHMSLLQQQGIISAWHHRKTPAGAERDATSNDYLSSADVILLLISPAFLASDITRKEMQRALQRHDAGQAHVIPLLLRPCDWKHAPFAHLQVLPRNEKAITIWEKTDLAFQDIVKDIRLRLEDTSGPGFRSSFPSMYTSIILQHTKFIFISHARTDLSLANLLKKDLQTHGIRGWGSRTAFLLGSPNKKRGSTCRNP